MLAGRMEGRTTRARLVSYDSESNVKRTRRGASGVQFNTVPQCQRVQRRKRVDANARLTRLSASTKLAITRPPVVRLS